jgi:hypothetical protein
VGGLVGHTSSDTVIENSSSSVDINLEAGNNTGGLVGTHSGKIINSYATGNIFDDRGGSITGGLVGNNFGGLIEQSYATGNIETTIGSQVGGLVGRNTNQGAIVKSFATGKVYGSHTTGGLVGHNTGGYIQESYTMNGEVTGTIDGIAIGGLVGTNGSGSTIEDSYAMAKVTSHKVDRVGGLVGDNDGIVTQSYWNIDTTGQDTSSGSDPIFGKTDSEMKQEQTFIDWQFDTVWQIKEGVSYPYFQWQHEED